MGTGPAAADKIGAHLLRVKRIALFGQDRAQFAEGETRTETAGIHEISDVSPDSERNLPSYILILRY